jgi:hypothetical protein
VFAFGTGLDINHLEGAAGICPLYSMLGIDTCPVNRR